MTVMVALLRGVNVGGRTRLAMADLRAAAEECDYERVRTYIQSGNVVFSAPSSDTSTVATRLRRALADRTGLDPEIVVRTSEELRAVLEANPYVGRGEDPAHLHVVFTNGDAQASFGSIDLAARAPDEAAAVGQHLYLFLPSGLGRSKLVADLARQKGPPGTIRNWRTVTKLSAMAEETD